MAEELDSTTVPVDFVKEGGDWLAIFNPRVPRQMDVQLAARYVHDGVVCSVKFSLDGTFLAVGMEGAVVLYNLTLGEKFTFTLESNSGKPNHARAVCISPDDHFLVAGSEDRLIRVWSITNRMLVHALEGHSGEVYALAFTPDNNTLLSASGDCTIRVWDATQFAETPDASSIILDETMEATCRVLRPVSPGVKLSSKLALTSIAVDSTGKFVAGGSLDGMIRIWKVDGTENGSTEPVETLRGHEDAVYSVQFVVGGLVSASVDRALKHWNISEVGVGRTECRKTLQGHKDCILATSALQVGRDQRVVSSSRDGTVRMWDLKTGMVQFVIQGHKNTVTTVDLCKDGRLLASGSGDCEVRLWSYLIV
ncbi:WD40-repeat-containing domain protein [Suillus fuscotomentosus]|uniref:WD40-repeat-containing domain protein n=1 Tax=Suillus fuscotomentosus TaxID=1912939 RepID=A0AAD4E2L5_9AGAM|nr:WD40-repeat-containing domain protein [Suillus fuscotomentosus]KAG1898462.1 WD40-repeat-containing domain protein [Suillus fuscotomentosus]